MVTNGISRPIYDDGIISIKMPPDASARMVAWTRAISFLNQGLWQALKYVCIGAAVYIAAYLPLAAAYLCGAVGGKFLVQWIGLGSKAFMGAICGVAATAAAHGIYYAVDALRSREPASSFSLSDSAHSARKKNAPDRKHLPKRLLAAAAVIGVGAALRPPSLPDHPPATPREYREQLEPNPPAGYAVRRSEISAPMRKMLAGTRGNGRA